jgi:hypothetical protein
MAAMRLMPETNTVPEPTEIAPPPQALPAWSMSPGTMSGFHLQN